MVPPDACGLEGQVGVGAAAQALTQVLTPYCSQPEGAQVTGHHSQRETREKQKCTFFFKPQRVFFAPDLSNDYAEDMAGGA